MLIATSIVTGFQSEIRQKVIGFGGHIRITSFNYENTNVSNPISLAQSFYPTLNELEEVKNIQVYALKEAIIKTDESIYGVIAKGISQDFDWDFFNQNLIEGKPLELGADKPSNEILLSATICNKMALKIGDEFLLYFFKDGKARPRKFTISGIYDTGLEKYDKAYVLLDIKHIQKLNDWKETEVGGFEVLFNNYKTLQHLDPIIDKHIGFKHQTETITQTNQDIFGWLELQDINVIVILSLMILVSAVSMSSGLLILILDQTNLVGMLKAMGALNRSIQRIFIISAARLILTGLIWGNLIGYSLLFLQSYFKILKLNKETYYLDYVPVNLGLNYFILINLGTFILCSFIMIIPSSVIAKIHPIKTIKFN